MRLGARNERHETNAPEYLSIYRFLDPEGHRGTIDDLATSPDMIFAVDWLLKANYLSIYCNQLPPSLCVLHSPL